MSINNPNYSAVAPNFAIAVSIAASTSATPALQFRGIYVGATCTISYVGLDDIPMVINNAAIGVMLWVCGKYITSLGGASVGYTLVGKP